MRIGAIAGMVGCLLLLSAFLAGCTGTPAKSSFTVDENGILSIAAAPPTISEQVLFSNETYTKAKIVMQTGNGDVVTYLSTPPTPKAAIVYAPGAGERLAGHEERMVRFATSLEPGTYIREISPRPVWMFHAKSDPIIPFESGRDLFSRAGEPKTFLEFSGDHGINPDVDAEIIGQWAQIYGPRG